MYKNKLYILLVVGLTLLFATKAFASLTLSTNSIIGTSSSTIDLGSGHDLYLQTNGGKVGIGTTTPGTSLDIGGFGSPLSFGSGSNTTAKVAIADNWNGVSGVQMYNSNSGNIADFRFAIFDDAQKQYVAVATPRSGYSTNLFGNPRNTSNFLFNSTLAGGTARNLTVGTVGSTDLIFGTGNTERMRISGSTGNIGIGTTAPSASLTIIGDVSNNRILEIHNNFAVGEDIYTHSDTSFRSPVIDLYRSKGTQSSPTAVVNGSVLGVLQFSGYGTSYGRGAMIQSTPEETWTGSTGAANLTFSTNPSGTFDNPSERLRITGAGNVGIGATSPRAGSKLEVAGIIQTDAQSTDPGCTATADIGKFWFDNTTSTTAVKVCKAVSGVVGWSVLTTTP